MSLARDKPGEVGHIHEEVSTDAVGNAAKLVGIGIGIGLISAVALTRLISSLLFGVSPFDLATLAAVSLFLAGVAVLASYIPAHRAAKTDPIRCLRYE